MTKFRPCIDLHEGKVKQIVGSSLTDAASDVVSSVRENHVSEHSASWFAEKYAADQLTGGHVIKLGPGNDSAARASLAAYPNGLQVGGGISIENSAEWIEAGASHVIVTSWLFDQEGIFQFDRLKALAESVGRDRIVVDLSCKATASGWTVAMNRWQTLTDLDVTLKTLDRLANHCAEFLIHAADVEGLCQGIDERLVTMLGKWDGIPMTYAGGVSSLKDVELVEELSDGRIDVTVGSSLDLFGGTGVHYADLVKWNQRSIDEVNSAS